MIFLLSSCIYLMREKIVRLLIFIPILAPSVLFAQMNEAKRIQDSIAIARSEQKLNGDSSLFEQIPSSLSSIDTSLALVKSDSTIGKAKNHSPKKAALFSAILPGLGQAYNKKYWKIPIVYAGFAGLSYAVYYTATNYNKARTAYKAQVDEDPTTEGSFNGVAEPNTLKEYRDYHKKNLTISGICMGLWYFLNIIDATVDAHLFDFNMSDKLSLHLQPALKPTDLGYAYTSYSYGGQINIIF